MEQGAPSSCPGTNSSIAGQAAPCQGCPNQAVCKAAAVSGPKGPDPDLPLIREALSCVKNVILVMSGKGGVGKSTVACQLAYAFAQEESVQVGLLDIDICGPSVPVMMDCAGETIHISGAGMSPVYARDNLAVMSIGFLLRDHEGAVIWRGPKKNGLIRQFLKDVDWGHLDYLIIDTPPGTSDEHLTIVQLLLKAEIAGSVGAILVTTPQEMALQDVRKEIDFCNKLNMPIIGVIENMASFHCASCNHTSNPFPRLSGGAERLCSEYNLSLLGSLPLSAAIAKYCDEGSSIMDKPFISKSFQAILTMLQERLPNREINSVR